MKKKIPVKREPLPPPKSEPPERVKELMKLGDETEAENQEQNRRSENGQPGESGEPGESAIDGKAGAGGAGGRGGQGGSYSYSKTFDDLQSSISSSTTTGTKATSKPRVFEKQFIVLIAIVGLGTAVFAFNPYLILQGQKDVQTVVVQIRDLVNIVRKVGLLITQQNSAQQQGINSIIQNQNNNTKLIVEAIKQVRQSQEDNNKRGNITVASFEKLIEQVIDSEGNIIGNLSDHRKIANMTRDSDAAKLNQILSLLNHTR